MSTGGPSISDKTHICWWYVILKAPLTFHLAYRKGRGDYWMLYGLGGHIWYIYMLGWPPHYISFHAPRRVASWGQGPLGTSAPSLAGWLTWGNYARRQKPCQKLFFRLVFQRLSSFRPLGLRSGCARCATRVPSRARVTHAATTPAHTRVPRRPRTTRNTHALHPSLY